MQRIVVVSRLTGIKINNHYNKTIVEEVISHTNENASLRLRLNYLIL